MFTYPYQTLEARLLATMPELRELDWYLGQDSPTDKNVWLFTSPAAFIEFTIVDGPHDLGHRIQSAVVDISIHLLTENAKDKGAKIISKSVADPNAHAKLMDKLHKNLHGWGAKLSQLAEFAALAGTDQDQRVLTTLSRVSVVPPHRIRKTFIKSIQRFRCIAYDHSACKLYTSLIVPVELVPALTYAQPSSDPTAPPPDEATTLLDGLVHVWKLDESGTSVNDLRMDSVGDAHLTPTDTLMAQADGVHGKAYTNDGQNRALFTTRSEMKNIVLNSFTFTCWCKFNAVEGDNGRILSVWIGSDDQRSFVFGKDPVGNVVLSVSKNGLAGTGNVFSTFSPSGVTQGDWHFCACWYNKDNGEIGVQLNEVASTSITETIFVSTVNFQVGRYNTSDGLFNGQVDELYCWNRVLTTEERAELYNSGAGKFYPFAS